MRRAQRRGRQASVQPPVGEAHELNDPRGIQPPRLGDPARPATRPRHRFQAHLSPPRVALAPVPRTAILAAPVAARGRSGPERRRVAAGAARRRRRQKLRRHRTNIRARTGPAALGQPPASPMRDVLDDDPRRGELGDDASELGPESRASTGEACSSASDGDVLAGESAAENGNAREVVLADRPDVFMLECLRPGWREPVCNTDRFRPETRPARGPLVPSRAPGRRSRRRETRCSSCFYGAGGERGGKESP